jgi:hypothetical protein
MNAARVRIGRVTLKAGGADLHVLPRPEPRGKIVDALEKWVRRFDDLDRPPQAVAAVAFSEVNGQWQWSCVYHSETPFIPLRLLPLMASEYLRSAIIGDTAEEGIMAILDCSRDETDPAS